MHYFTLHRFGIDNFITFTLKNDDMNKLQKFIEVNKIVCSILSNHNTTLYHFYDKNDVDSIKENRERMDRVIEQAFIIFDKVRDECLIELEP